MRVAIYARVSRAEHDDPNSIPVQLADCRRWAKDEGHEVVAEYVDEGKSAWNPRNKRRGYEQMVTDLQVRRFDAPLARDTERLLRQDKEGARWLELAAAGLVRRLLFADEDAIDFTKARSRQAFKERVAGAVGYSERLQEKIRSTFQLRAENGHYTGKRPFGYDIVSTNGGKTLQIRKDEAVAVREAAEQLLNGRSLKAIAREWNAVHRCGRSWTGNTLRQMLSAPRLAGLRQHRDQIIGQADWEPIIDRRTWQRLMDLFNDPERITAARTRGDRYLLTGLLFCEEHGTRLAGRPVSYRRRDGTRVAYRTYICTHGGPDQRSVHLGINARRVEDYIGDMASMKTIRITSVRDPSEVGIELLAIRDEVDSRISLWNRNAATAGLSADEIRDGRRDLVAERERIEAQIAEAATPAQLAEPVWKKDEAGAYTDEWRQMTAQRIQRVNVRAGAKTVPIEERAEIVWRDGVIDIPWLTE
jgi:site-specific DNA recombinase